MVRGNFQKRIEKAEARKQETKQRKQQHKDLKLWKQHFKTFLSKLDDTTIGQQQQQQITR